MKTPKLTTLSLAALALLSLVACGGGGDQVADDGTGAIKIGAIFDLTGPTSDVGTPYADGLRDYVTWFNQQGGLDGREIDLLFQDYGYKVDQAEQLYSQFVQEGVVAFMGWGTGDTEALRGRIADDQIPFMSASYSHVLGNPAEAPYNFLAGTTYSDQLFIVLDWILENNSGVDKVAIMHHPSPFGRSPYDQGGKDYAASKGVELELHEMARGSTDFTAELTRIVESGASHVIFQNVSTPVALAVRNASELGHDLDFYCLNWCTNEVLTDLAGDAAEGVIGSVIYSPPGEGIEGLADAEAYLQSTGSSLAEAGMPYAQGWWTMALMIEGVKRAAAAGPVTGEAIRDALESMQSFDTGGVTTPISFSSTDHRGLKGMRLYQVKDGKWQQLSDLITAES